MKCDAETKRKAVAEYNDGVSPAELSVKYGVAESSVYKWIREGIKDDNRAQLRENRKKALESHNSGKTVLEIAHELDVAPNTVYYWLRLAGVTEFNTREKMHNADSPQIAEDYRNGVPIAEVASKYGISVNTAYTILRREKVLGMKIVKRDFNPVELYIDYLDGMTVKDIAKKYGYSPTTVQDVIRATRSNGNKTLTEYLDMLNDVKLKLEQILYQQRKISERLDELEGKI